METTLPTTKTLSPPSLIMGILLASLLLIHVHAGLSSPAGQISGHRYRDHIRKMQALKASVVRRDSVSLPPSSISPSPAHSPVQPPTAPITSRVYQVTSYGADPTGKTDSTEALLKAISDASEGAGDGYLMAGIVNVGGAQVSLEGGIYLISRPLRLPTAGRGNLVIQGGSIKASDDFPTDGYLVDLSPPSTGGTASEYNYEYTTLRDLMLDSNYRGGGIRVVNSLRTTIDNCYVVHFTTNGVLAQSGHETYIRNSFFGQHITAGADSGERNFSGTAINLMGNDNAVTDVVIFSAAVGVLVSGQANTLSGVHCYNKATGFGGTGIYLKLPGLTQTRIVNSYMDYTGIVAEDPVQLHISSTFFLGDAHILLKSINGVASGVNIVGNMFSGSGTGVDIVQLDERNGAFKNIDQVVVDQNQVKGMNLKATVARASVEGNGSSASWTVDLNPTLLFPNRIKHVQYTFTTAATSFPLHVLRNISNNRVLIQSDVAVPATVSVTADQGL